MKYIFEFDDLAELVLQEMECRFPGHGLNLVARWHSEDSVTPTGIVVEEDKQGDDK